MAKIKMLVNDTQFTKLAKVFHHQILHYTLVCAAAHIDLLFHETYFHKLSLFEFTVYSILKFIART